MEELYLERLPVELIKIICDYVPDESLINFFKIELSNIQLVDSDYFYWIDRLKRGYSTLNDFNQTTPVLDNLEYLIDDKISDNYLHLKSVLANIEKLTIEGIYLKDISGWLHNIPFRFLPIRIKELIADLYIKSMIYGQVKKMNGKMVFEGYSYNVTTKRAGNRWRDYCLLIRDTTAKDPLDTCQEILLNYDEAFNLVTMLGYFHPEKVNTPNH